MKKCRKCGHENDDDMRFCLECAAQLQDAPIIVSWNDTSSAQKQSDVDTASFGQSMQTKIAGGSTFPNNFQTAPHAAPAVGGRSKKKMFIVAGGIAALLLLVLAAGAAIVGYNILLPPSKPVVYNPTPTASPTRSNEKSPTPKPSATPKKTEESSESPDDSPTPYTNNSDGENLAAFKRMRVDYNVTEKGKTRNANSRRFLGLSDEGRQLLSGRLFSEKDGTKLYTDSQGYRSKDGQVAVYKSLNRLTTIRIIRTLRFLCLTTSLISTAAITNCKWTWS